MSEHNRLVNFFFESGILQSLKRSGNIFLGSGDQNVASHIFRTAVIAYTMAYILNANKEKVLITALFHDIEETRIGDLNYLQQMYVRSDDSRALADQLKGLPIEKEIGDLIKDYGKLETIESQIVKDADTLELILYLKEQYDKGNKQALNWINAAKKRLITELGKEIAVSIENSNYYDWWYNIRDDWENGSKEW
ncbi:MAG: HD domain-containing protein [Calditerrivibrio sp.]|nr:HD domain-containing protein [Calditerrivibrio sp.]